MNDEARQARTQQVIDDAQRLIAEVDAALEAGQRFFTERGFSRKQIEELNRQASNDPATQKAVARVLEEARQEAQTVALHRRFETTTPVPPRARRLRNLV